MGKGVPGLHPTPQFPASYFEKLARISFQQEARRVLTTVGLLSAWGLIPMDSA